MNGERIKVKYNPLWEILINKDISKGELRKKTSIAPSAFTTSNENVSLDVLVRICCALNCGIDDIVEIER